MINRKLEKFYKFTKWLMIILGACYFIYTLWEIHEIVNWDFMF